MATIERTGTDMAERIYVQLDLGVCWYTFIVVVSQVEACGMPEANVRARETTCDMSGGRSRKGLEQWDEYEVARSRRTTVGTMSLVIKWEVTTPDVDI